jgi:Rha family phage regulatory protein
MSDSPKLPASNRVPAVFGKSGDIFADSRDVAKFFEKRHDHVLRDIDNLIRKDSDLLGCEFTPAKYGELNFGDCKINGLAPFEGYRCFHMTRDGFTLLSMGFTGERALKFKRAYIQAFNTQEAILRKGAAPLAIDVRDPRQLAVIATQLIQVNEGNRRDLVGGSGNNSRGRGSGPGRTSLS